MQAINPFTPIHTLTLLEAIKYMPAEASVLREQYNDTGPFVAHVRLMGRVQQADGMPWAIVRKLVAMHNLGHDFNIDVDDIVIVVDN